jgi:hypothetical protein
MDNVSRYYSRYRLTVFEFENPFKALKTVGKQNCNTWTDAYMSNFIMSLLYERKEGRMRRYFPGGVNT